jgi:membrane-associated phospholipid phosphatase
MGEKSRSFKFVTDGCSNCVLGYKIYVLQPKAFAAQSRNKNTYWSAQIPSYISGHSTFSGAAATILGHLIPEKSNLFNEMALEASFSRLYGAIHYRSDCEVGLEVGKKVGDFAIQRAQNDGAN